MSEKRTDRVNFRTTARLVELLDKAAAHKGQTRTQFALEILEEEAKKVLARKRKLEASRRLSRRWREGTLKGEW